MTTPLIDAQLADLERLYEESCPGWRLHENGRTILTSQSHPLAEVGDPWHRQILVDGKQCTGRDAELAVALYTAGPLLLAEVRRLSASAESARRVVEGLVASAPEPDLVGDGSPEAAEYEAAYAAARAFLAGERGEVRDGE